MRILADLTNDQLTELAQFGQMLTFPSGKILVAQGEPADAMYLIIDGKAGAYFTDSDKNETHLRTLDSGAQFGEMGLLESGDRTATVRAVNTCKVFRLDAEGFAQLLKRPELASRFLLGLSRSLAARLAHITNRYADARSLKDIWSS